MDVHTKEQRRYNMSQIKSKNTKPELVMFDMLKKTRLKYLRHSKNIIGKPDIVFVKSRLVIFIDGEFWHGKNFKEWRGKLNSFWLDKITGNIRRDKKNDRILRKEGWHVMHLWGKDIIRKPEASLRRIISNINKLGN